MPEAPDAEASRALHTAPGARESRYARTEYAIYVGVALASLVLIWSVRFIPLQDYPDWVYQAWLFARWSKGALPAPFAWAGWPAPNAVSTLVMGGLSLWMPAEVSGRVFLSAYVFAFLAAARWLFRSAGETPALVPACLVWNYSVLHGNISYAWSLPVLFGAIAYLLQQRERAHPLLIALAAITLYACHAATWCVWLLLLGTFVIERRSLRLSIRWLLALLPSFVLAAGYAARRLSEAKAPEPAAGPLHALSALGSFAEFKLSTLLKFFAPFPALYPLYEPVRVLVPCLVALNLAFFGLLLFQLRGALQRLWHQERWLGHSVAIMLFAFVVAPRSAFGLVNPGERLLIPAAMVLAATHRVRLPRWGVALFAAFACLQLSFLLPYASYASRQLSALHASLARNVGASAYGTISESHFDYVPLRPKRDTPPLWNLLPRHYPFVSLPLYSALERGVAAATFDTGLFRATMADRDYSSWQELARPGLASKLIVLGDPAGTRTIAAKLTRYRTLDQGIGYTLLVAR